MPVKEDVLGLLVYQGLRQGLGLEPGAGTAGGAHLPWYRHKLCTNTLAFGPAAEGDGTRMSEKRGKIDDSITYFLSVRRTTSPSVASETL